MLNKTIIAERWVCSCCNETRRTNFCSLCGEPRPPERTLPQASLDALRQIARAMRQRQQTESNTANTFEQRGIFEGPDGYERNGFELARGALKRAKKYAEQADVVEWAIAELSQFGGKSA